MRPAPPPTLAVIFDLDGVLVSTDELHFLSWKALADREGIPFDRHDNERLRGVSRMESLEIILERSPAGRTYSHARKEALAAEKNEMYRAGLMELTPRDTLPGARDLLAGLRRRGVRTAVGSASRNARLIVHRVGLEELLDTIVDGNDCPRSKPAPDVFLLAAKRLGMTPAACLVVEDAESGVRAALAAGMRVLGIGERTRSAGAHAVVESLAAVSPDDIGHV